MYSDSLFPDRRSWSFRVLEFCQNIFYTQTGYIFGSCRQRLLAGLHPNKGSRDLEDPWHLVRIPCQSSTPPRAELELGGGLLTQTVELAENGCRGVVVGEGEGLFCWVIFGK